MRDLDVVRRRRNPAAVPRPVCMEELASRLIDALIGVRTKEVALRLQKISRQPTGPVAVKERKRCGECRSGYAQLDGMSKRLAPRRLVLIDGAGEEAVEEQILERRVLVK